MLGKTNKISFKSLLILIGILTIKLHAKGCVITKLNQFIFHSQYHKINSEIFGNIKFNTNNCIQSKTITAKTKQKIRSRGTTTRVEIRYLLENHATFAEQKWN